jgi:outer membrane lipase/esterase
MMKTLPRTLLVCCLLAPWLTASAGEPAHGFSQLFVFGDSLSDPGNRFADTRLTANPPFAPIPDDAYGVGGHHFSNGATWVENLAKRMDLIEGGKPAMINPRFGNYAYSGARTRDYLVDQKPDFSAQVASFLAANGGQAPADALYVVQFGGNDLRDALDAALSGQDPAPIIGDAVTAMVTNIGTLAAYGARHIMIANAPNLGIAPAVPDFARATVTGLSYFYNTTVADALAVLQPYGLTIYEVDLFGFTSAAAMYPEAFGFSTLAPCLTFGVTQGAFCEDGDEHLFWDAIHPTKAAHRLIGEIAYNELPD